MAQETLKLRTEAFCNIFFFTTLNMMYKVTLHSIQWFISNGTTVQNTDLSADADAFFLYYK